MATRQTTLLGGTVAAVLLVLATSWLLWRYYGASDIDLPDGSTVRDLSVAEAGEFAGPEYESMRRGYFSRLEKFKQWDFVGIGDPTFSNVREVVRPLVEQSLAADAASSSALDRAPPDAKEGLVTAVASIIAAMAGTEREDYLAALPGGMTISRPTHMPAVELMANKFDRDLDLPAEDSPPEAWQPVFADIYSFNQGYNDGQFLLSGLVSEQKGFRVAVREHSHGVVKPLFEQRYGEEDRKLFLGGASQGQPVFYKPVDNSHSHGHSDEGHHHDDDVLLESVAVFVMRDKGGDMYPVSVYINYDGDRGTWVVTSVSRLVSPRVMVAPFFAF